MMNFEIILATNNAHKLKEFREILSPFKIVVYGLSDLNLQPEEVMENGKDYYENALFKAKSVAKLTSFPIIADDSGLEVEAMNNAPGLFTARYAKEKGGQTNANLSIIENVKDANRKAHFVCHLAVLNIEKQPLHFVGISDGVIAKKPGGEEGFGYDPIFIPDEENKTFAEIANFRKNQISHRGKALLKFVTYLRVAGLI